MRNLISFVLLAFVIALVGCSSEEKTEENDKQKFSQADFELELPGNDGNIVSLSPDGKTMYTYFTGVG